MTINIKKIDKPLVSVIMPTYNHAKFIGRTIESVLNQTYQNWEMLIVDDASTDNTSDIVEKYSSLDSRILFFKFNRNTGKPAASRNHGIKHARGEYIAFLDSDDLWLPEKLEKQIELFKNTKEIAMVYTRYKTIKEDTISSNIFPKNGRYKSGNIFKSLYLRSFVACSGVMVKRSVLDQVGLFSTDPDLIAIEDTDLWLRIALKYKIKCTNESPLLLYRIQRQGISYGYIQKLRRSLRLKRRYKKLVSNYLFWKSTIFTLGYILKEMFMPQRSHYLHQKNLSDKTIATEN